MIFGWKDRALRAERLLDLAHAETRRERDIADVRYDDLLIRFMAVITPPSPTESPAPPDIAPRTPSVISQTIRDESGGDVRLAAHFRKRARQLKLEHKDWSDEQIAEQLRQWQTTETEGAA